MQSLAASPRRVVGILLGILAVAPAQAQQTNRSNYARAQEPPARSIADQPEKPGAIHRIELYSGTRRSVRYLPSGNVSSSDRAAARELQRAENEDSYLLDLEKLKQQYVVDERILEQHRRAVQQQLYGKSIESERDSSNLGSQRYMGGYGYATPYGSGMPGAYRGYPYAGGYGYPGYGYGGYGGYGARMGGMRASMGHSKTTVRRSLENGVGDEGRIKDAMSKAIANEASPEYAHQALRDYEKAMKDAASSPVLAKTLSLRKTPTATASADELSYPENSSVTLWIGRDKYEGVVKADRPDWIILRTDEGDMRVRKSSIERAVVRTTPKGTPARTTAAK